MRRWARSAFFPIWPATIVLILLSPVLARGALNESAVIGMIPFAAILAVAAVGQTLVIQQRGLDLSLPGILSLATVIVTKVPANDPGQLPLALVLVAIAGLVAGLANGLSITRFRITPLVATLGVNALLVGTVLALTSGTSTASSPMALSSFALARTFGVPNTALVAIGLIAMVATFVSMTAYGRRFVAVGANVSAAHAGGITVSRYLIATYVVAAWTYGLAGVLLTGFLGIPGPLPGDNYLLPSIAAVVLGGTSLAGGAGSVAATAAGAVFLTQLGLLVRAMGAPASVQLIITGSIIALGMGLRLVPWRRLLSHAAVRRRPVPEGGEP